ncbi:hypothetical protein C8034_v011935 [Colletotrichum sidae]|uniref:Uncharacterized protein n=1 Tax=Colletotrichum sidae TaxID=1347389 RepID=A0A4R8TLZ3_9PEZI|nr:hypothetical protein C8034_v011935 [Colletotrichum sidae]
MLGKRRQGCFCPDQLEFWGQQGSRWEWQRITALSLFGSRLEDPKNGRSDGSAAS